MKVHLLLPALGFLAAGAAHAQTVLVDFGNASSFRGVTITGTDVNGNTWNSVWSGAYYPSLLDLSGSATGIGFGFTNVAGTDSFNGPAGATSTPPTAGEIAATDIDAGALGNLGVKEAAIDYYVNSTFEIQNLDAGKTYDLTFFASRKFATDDATVFGVYTDNTYATLVASGTLNHQTPGSPWLHNRDTTLTLSGLAPQALNFLYVKFMGSGGNSGYLNAMQLYVVPEPTTVAAVAGGTGLLLLRRRRRA